jgi:hypothetical protein
MRRLPTYRDLESVGGAFSAEGFEGVGRADDGERFKVQPQVTDV